MGHSRFHVERTAKLNRLRAIKPEVQAWVYKAAHRTILGWTLGEVSLLLDVSEGKVVRLLEVAERLTGDSYGRREARVGRPPKRLLEVEESVRMAATRCGVCGLVEPHECLSAQGRGHSEGWTW
jgi:hypothetical protein